MVGGMDQMVTNVAAHELVETVTDPVGGNGWWDGSNGYEISDKCAWQVDKMRLSDGYNYTVQLQWSNRFGSCQIELPSKVCSSATCPAGWRCNDAGACVDPCSICTSEIGRAVQQECRDRSRMPSSA
eukprot:TRINITY_DN24336_c0_g1_i3.p1 TRINITY_DN24336_c0_g1~~TRINITY_DN24336_c0_g1_i3.p1  ORF type:complete len:127 (-),score=17.63 TRINITY_DN24336_c0_g1_i3:10-390(-)